MRSLTERYLIGIILLACLLSAGWPLAARDGAPFSGAGLFVAIEMPGAILRPDAWLFNHRALTPLMTSVLAAIVWTLPIFILHAIFPLAGRRIALAFLENRQALR